MKNLIITLLLSSISILSVAQTPFTEKVFRDINERLLADFPKFLNEETSPDYTFTSSTGWVNNLDQMKKTFSDGNKITQWDLSEIKIKQVGTAAIVRGINKHSIFFGNSNITAQYNLRFTYTYEFKNKKWMALTAQHSDIITPSADDEAAIKKLIENERTYYHTGNTTEFMKLWKDDPKTFFLAGNMNLDNEAIKKIVPTLKATGMTTALSNYRIKIIGNMAVADFDQLSTNAQGAKDTEHDLLVLEKVNGTWKFIGASNQGVMTKEDEPEGIVRDWIAEYNKDNKAFFVNNCSNDYIASNTGINGGKFFGREFINNRAEGVTSDLETTNMKSFKGGNLAVVIGNLIWHHKQADGSDKPDRTVSTFVLQKRGGKWWYVGHHISPLKE